ncbi:Protein kinase superfamily protein [Rhynchospora pubera]|uniref:Protein kinase superfamily protein n=1 Tax=Rhynchospora pubera TaxID=906938 RepID=A0AAV8DVU8_9POAL|nr:Protein kinase superfamily protein [Rhynchospora pubera]
MKGGEPRGLIIGVTVGVIIGIFIAIGALFCIKFRKSRSQIGNSSSRRSSTVPFRPSGTNTCTELSDSTVGPDSPKLSEKDVNVPALWPEGKKRKNILSVSGIPKYSYKEVQKATANFTALIGQGAFGPVYKAQMSTGEIIAVKVLANDSKQGEKEFQNEVLLLGRLHHRNLVNLVGYCAEKGQHMLIYVFMPNGSLASHLYGGNHEALKWDQRVNIAIDVARGLEYLHDGAVPPVVHRDIKSANILLDRSMRARVADFGLSREEMVSRTSTSLRGTFGYLDPEYVSSRNFTKKSDVYSYGVLLFELIAGRNPQQGLMEYVELAAINTEGKSGWEEIADSRLEGSFDVEELNDMATIAYKCVNKISRKRPAMRDVVQFLSRVVKMSRSRKRHSKKFSAEEGSAELDARSEARSSVSENPNHQRSESVDSVSDLPEV